MRGSWSNMDPVQKAARIAKIREGCKRRFTMMSPEERAAYKKRASINSKNWWATVSEEEKAELLKKLSESAKARAEATGKRMSEWWQNTPPDRLAVAKAKMSQYRKEWWKNLTPNERAAKIKNMRSGLAKND